MAATATACEGGATRAGAQRGERALPRPQQCALPGECELGSTARGGYLLLDTYYGLIRIMRSARGAVLIVITAVVRAFSAVFFRAMFVTMFRIGWTWHMYVCVCVLSRVCV